MATYTLYKNFASASEAIDEITGLSYSLGQSDLNLFRGCNTLEKFRAAQESEAALDSWASFETVEHEDCFMFSFETATGVNSLRLIVESSGQALAAYDVVSDHSVRDSSAVQACEDAGWTLEEENIDPAEQEKLEQEEDTARLVELGRCLGEKRIPGLHFHVGWDETGEVPVVMWHSIATSPTEAIKALKLAPQFAYEILQLAEIELEENVFICPKVYEYNGLPRGGEESWYSAEYAEYKKGLQELIGFCRQLLGLSDDTDEVVEE